MTEDEWRLRGDWELRRFVQKAEDRESSVPHSERLTFMWAWNRAGKEAGIIK